MTVLQLCIEYAIAGAIRYLFMISEYQKLIAERVEVSTPLNAWERVTEAAHLHDKHGIDPYTTDIFHDTPLNLEFYKFLINNCSKHLPLVFIACDLLAASFLYLTAKRYMEHVQAVQVRDKHKYSEKSYSFLLTTKDFNVVPNYVVMAYLFNPYIVFNCIGMTTTTFTNVFLAIAFYGLITRRQLITFIFLALATTQSLYPSVLVMPFAIQRAQNQSRNGKTITIALSILSYAAILYSVLFASYCLTGNWRFIQNVWGFILNVSDLRPNIGTTWYFFTEMFEHFRLLFIWSLQLNVSVLYLVPLSLKFRKEPLLLACALTALTAMFRTYPSIGDVGFYLSLLPLWRHLLPFMQQRFIICCIFLMTSVIAPVFWHLWIYSSAANANFYFGVTLAFTVAQIFILTDFLFAYVTRQYILKNGCLDEDDAQKYKLILW